MTVRPASDPRVAPPRPCCRQIPRLARLARLTRLARLALTCVALWQPWPALALDLNAATEAELDGLSGFGPAFTARVMQARAERPFVDWADFMHRVKGVRESTAWRLSRQGARIQEMAYTPSAPASVPTPSARRVSRD